MCLQVCILSLKCFPSLYPLTSLRGTLVYKDTIYYFPAMTLSSTDKMLISALLGFVLS